MHLKVVEMEGLALEEEELARMLEIAGYESPPLPDKGYEKKELRSQIDAVFDDIRPRDAVMLRKRFGLREDGIDASQMTIAALAEEMGCSRENVARILKRGLRSLRSFSNLRKLRPFVG